VVTFPSNEEIDLYENMIYSEWDLGGCFGVDGTLIKIGKPKDQEGKEEEGFSNDKMYASFPSLLQWTQRLLFHQLLGNGRC